MAHFEKEEVKVIIHKGYCPCGRPYFVTTHYNGTHIAYLFVICETHKVEYGT